MSTHFLDGSAAIFLHPFGRIAFMDLPQDMKERIALKNALKFMTGKGWDDEKDVPGTIRKGVPAFWPKGLLPGRR